MKLILRVDVEGRYWSGGAAVEVPELVCQQFEPMKTCDDRVLAAITGEICKEEARVVIKARVDAAKILAGELTEMIMHEMKKNDTHNGYPTRLINTNLKAPVESK